MTSRKMARSLIAGVTDTAHWMAAYRAAESARPDALFDDRFAERLAGDAGMAMAAQAPRAARDGWPWITRAKLVDELTLASVADGCDRVLNLAAGLDTRPYRLPLSAALPWIEADLPAVIAEKERVLAGEAAHCGLSRESIDLADPGARASFFDRNLLGARRALVITEGLLGYLDQGAVQSLVQDLRRPGIRWWITDVSSPALRRVSQKRLRKHLANAPLKFAAPESGVAWFEAFGWEARDIRSVVREAVRFRRAPFWLLPVALLSREPDPRSLGNRRWYAVVRFEQKGSG
jgi:methyltransferase (TIGR00027 family)